MLTTAEYTYQYDSITLHLAEQLARKQDLIETLSANKNALSEWQEKKTVLQNRAAKGDFITSWQWERLEKAREEIEMQTPRIQLGIDRNAYTISMTLQKLFGFHNEMEEDYHRNSLTSDKYKCYLSDYKKLFDGGVILPEAIKAIADRIKKAITIFNIP